MKIKYYGTSAGAGIPEIFCSCRVCEQARREGGKNVRTRSQAVIDGVLGIDYPVDTFLHTIYGGLDMRTLKTVLITHAHYDHFLPADILSRAVGMTEPIKFCFSEQSGRNFCNSLKARAEAFRTGKSICNHNEVLVETAFLEPYREAVLSGYRVIPLKARHGGEIGALNYVIQKDGKSILWAHDTGKLYPEVLEFLKESGIRFDFVSLDCTLKRGEQITPNHMDLDWCIETAEALRNNRNADEKTVFMLSHIGHLVERTHEELSEEAAAYGMTVAYDGMTVEI